MTEAATSVETMAPAYFVRGEDPALVAQEARSLIDRLVAGRDPSLVVEEHGGSSVDGLEIGAVVDACTTPPFLVDRRVVVVRDAGRLGANDAARLVEALADPVPSIAVVLLAGGGTVPAGLVKAVTKIGEVVDTSTGRSARDRSAWFSAHLDAGPVRLSAGASRRLAAHLGEDVGRLEGILQTLAAAYGEGAAVDEEHLAPYLGEAGSVPPWDLTDAIDVGDRPAALAALRRMTGPGGREGPMVIGILHRHYARMLHLDGADVRGASDAAEILGERSEWTAKKAWERYKALGSDKVAEAVGLISTADLDLKGRSALPSEVVLDILVARLSRLAGPSRRR